jgi:hypothetical protein
MIYLIITTSINNKYGFKQDNERKEQYIHAISETLKYVPSEIKIIIVENNGERTTYLDIFKSNNVDIVYTNNNFTTYKSKGITEFNDIKEIIVKYDINDNDIIIKLTGRYFLKSDIFLKDIISNEKKYDAFIKFFDVCSLKYESNSCVLGCYAMRTLYLKLFNQININNYSSAEEAFARYVKICGANVKEIENIDLQCIFADDFRRISV